jgi:phage recombination protein Bet
MASTALVALTSNLAAKLNMGDGSGLVETLKATAFKGQVTDAQMTALLVVANQFGLNPWTKEIYAFPDKNNGIVPVVGVDGWSRIINNHPQFDGMDFEQDAESCTCIIHRKDRKHPVRVTEYMAECRRPNVGPWTSHPRRMLRHKAMIQCARLAFGYGGIYDQDEAERIVEAPKVIDPSTGEIVGFDLQTALTDVSNATTQQDVQAAWQKHLALAQQAKDKNGYDALKAAVVKRKDEITKGDVQDVSPRMDAEQMEHEDASR